MYLLAFHYVLAMLLSLPQCLHVTYTEKGAVFGLIERTFIVLILILPFEPEGPRFQLTFPFSRRNLKYG